jgi:hypothetical protein
MSIRNARDPREQLVREKYFSLRPKPLERWLWTQGVPAAAERVFWLHWQEGQQRGDWCSEVPIKRVAKECQLDISTVTRAYQLLQKMGCLRRTDPGRDPANPFQQATAVTEVRVPRELLVELDRHPNRRTRQVESTNAPTAGETHDSVAVTPTVEEAKPVDPFGGLSTQERLKATSELTQAMSAPEAQEYREALRWHRAHMSFDADSQLTAEARGRVLQLLSVLANRPARAPEKAPETAVKQPAGPRKLSVFELARLKRDIQAAATSAAAPELTRQVAWSIEEGALRRFAPAHALHIALKKIRAGEWTRPNRMPPHWVRLIGTASGPETCRRA